MALRRSRRRGRTSPLPDNLVTRADYIAGQFGLSATDFERYRHLGLIVVSVEHEANGEKGMSQVTCRLGNRVWTALVDAEGTVHHQETTFLRGKLARLNRAGD
jgi:hypothetical protein